MDQLTRLELFAMAAMQGMAAVLHLSAQQKAEYAVALAQATLAEVDRVQEVPEP